MKPLLGDNLPTGQKQFWGIDLADHRYRSERGEGSLGRPSLDMPCCLFFETQTPAHILSTNTAHGKTERARIGPLLATLHAHTEIQIQTDRQTDRHTHIHTTEMQHTGAWA